MNYEISTKEKSATKELNEFFTLLITIITLVVSCNQLGIWKFNKQGQLIFPFILENSEKLIGSFFTAFLLVNGILLLKKYFKKEQYDWHLFTIDSITFSIPFLLIASLIMLFSNPAGGIQLLATTLPTAVIGYFLYNALKLVMYRIRR